MRPYKNIITGKNVKAGDTIGYVGYYYNVINHPCICVNISEKGKTSAGDPMTPFGLETSFKKSKKTERVKVLSREQAVEDYTILVESLKEGFPGLYDYVTEKEFDVFVMSQLDGFDENVAIQELERSLVATLCKIKDSHTRLLNLYDEDPKAAPINISYIDSSLILSRTTPADTQYHGKKIKSIDGIESDSLVKMVRDYIQRYDGYNQSGIEFQLAFMFEIRYTRFCQDLTLGNDFTIVFEDGEEKVFKAESLLGRGCVPMRPDWSKWATINLLGKNLKGTNMKNINDSVAYLGIQTFDLDDAQVNEVADFIKQISRKSIDNLIIDMRNNPGGDIEVLNKLFSFIAKEDFQHEMYSVVTKQGDFDFFKHSTNHVVGDMLFDDYEYDEKSTYYVKNHNEIFSPDTAVNYFGKIYVIANEQTFSAASVFTGLVKKHDRGVVVGRETGTAYHQMKALRFEKLILPNSSYIVHFPLVKIVADTIYNERFPYGRGVMPDYPVKITLEEMESRDGDRLFNYTMQLIEDGKYLERPKVEAAEQEIIEEDDNNDMIYIWVMMAIVLVFLNLIIKMMNKRQ